MPSVSHVEYTPLGTDVYYLHHTIAIKEDIGILLDEIVECGVDVVPPIVYRGDGTASVKLIGNTEAIDQAIRNLPESIYAEIERMLDFHPGNESVMSVLTARQQDAVITAVKLGYYQCPRKAYIDDIAEGIGCAESTAGEHLRKAETKLLQTIVSGRYRHNSGRSSDSKIESPSLKP